jgi:signal transduction histidine kinase
MRFMSSGRLGVQVQPSQAGRAVLLYRHALLAVRRLASRSRYAVADTLDNLLARLEASFDNQRRLAANASHELRTP